MANNVVSVTDLNQDNSPIRIDQQEGFVSNRDNCTQKLLFGSQGNTLTDRAPLLKQRDGSKYWDGAT